MWKEYSKSYLKNNKAASISIMIAVLISSLFISAICTIFYNMWTDNIYRIKLKEGDWQAKITGAVSSEDVKLIETYVSVDKAVFHQKEEESEVLIYFYNPRKIYEEMPELVNFAGLDQREDITIAYHNTLLTQYFIYSPEEKRDPPLLLGFFLCVIVIVCFSLIMIIYNAFGITMNSRLHQLGILQSIGATPGQIRLILLQEAFALSLLPILVGIPAGIGINYGFLQLGNSIGDMVQREDSVFCYHPVVFLATVSACLLTVLLAAWKGAGRLSKIAPLDAIGNGGSRPVRKVKQFRLLSLLFGVEGELARKSLYIRRKEFRTAGVSLTLSFMIFTIFMDFMVLSDISTQQTYFERYKDTWDFMITVKDQDKDELKLRKEFRDITEVTDCTAYRKAEANTWLKGDLLSGELKKLGGPEMLQDTGIIKEKNRYLVSVQIVVLDDDSFRTYCSEAGIDYSLMTGPAAVAVNRIWDNIHSDFRNSKYITYLQENENQILEISPDTNSAREQKTIQVKLSAYTKQVPDLREEYDDFALLLIMSEASYKELPDISVSDEIYYKILASSDEQMEQIQNDITEILKDYSYEYTLENRIEKEKYNRSAREGWNLIMGSFCGLLAVIGIANVFANTLGSIVQRRKEFARYSSIGLTPAGMKKILFMEAFIVSIKPVLITLPVHILFMIFAVTKKYGEFIGIMPIKPLVIMALFIVASVGLAYTFSNRRLCGYPIVEALKDDTVI